MSRKPPPLTAEEKRWIKRFDRVLRAMPRRLLIVEAGDALTVVDRNRGRDRPLHDGHASDPEVFLAHIYVNGCITGVSG